MISRYLTFSSLLNSVIHIRATFNQCTTTELFYWWQLILKVFLFTFCVGGSCLHSCLSRNDHTWSDGLGSYLWLTVNLIQLFRLDDGVFTFIYTKEPMTYGCIQKGIIRLSRLLLYLSALCHKLMWEIFIIVCNFKYSFDLIWEVFKLP